MCFAGFRTTRACPLSLLEAMGPRRGAVASDLPSGIPDVVDATPRPAGAGHDVAGVSACHRHLHGHRERTGRQNPPPPPHARAIEISVGGSCTDRWWMFYPTAPLRFRNGRSDGSSKSPLPCSGNVFYSRSARVPAGWRELPLKPWLWWNCRAGEVSARSRCPAAIVSEGSGLVGLPRVRQTRRERSDSGRAESFSRLRAHALLTVAAAPSGGAYSSQAATIPPPTRF